MLTVIEDRTGAAADRTYEAGIIADGDTIAATRRLARGSRMFSTADLAHRLEA